MLNNFGETNLLKMIFYYGNGPGLPLLGFNTQVSDPFTVIAIRQVLQKVCAFCFLLKFQNKS